MFVCVCVCMCVCMEGVGVGKGVKEGPCFESNRNLNYTFMLEGKPSTREEQAGRGGMGQQVTTNPQ